MITLSNIDVAFDGTSVLGDLSLEVRKGEFFTLLGPSGCGKTTLLRTISGFVMPQLGRVAIDGRDVTALPPEDRGIGIVFQNYALFPHLTVFENVAFGLRVARAGRAEMIERVNDALSRIGVAEHATKKPAELSGGQQQRVAIARALILGSQVLLLDEPLSNLDAALRETMRSEIRDIQQRLGLTAVYVTHDQQEALAMSDRIAVMENGALTQIGSPRDLYDRPTSRFVCTFIGETSRLTPQGLATLGVNGVDGPAYVRPEHVELDRRDSDDWLSMTPVLRRAVFRGARTRLEVVVGDDVLKVDAPGDYPNLTEGQPVPVAIHRSRLHQFPEEDR